MKLIKKLGSFSLTLLLVFALGATVSLAQEETSTSANDSTSEVTDVELDESMEGDTVTDESTNTEADDEMEMTETGEIIGIDEETQEITIEDESGDAQTFPLAEGLDTDDLIEISIGDEVELEISLSGEEEIVTEVRRQPSQLGQRQARIVQVILNDEEEVAEVVVETQEGQQITYEVKSGETVVEREGEMVEATTLEVGEEVIVVVSEDGEVAEEIVVQPLVGPESDAGSPIAYILIVLIIILALYALFREKK